VKSGLTEARSGSRKLQPRYYLNFFQGANVNALFVHGMGRSSLSWLPTLARFRANGIRPYTFDYSVALQDFPSIVRRLVNKVVRLAARGDYVVVGHSLGGVLLRAALAALPAETPLPNKLFLLGSPVAAPRLARRLRKNFMFRAITRDCGQLLASPETMTALPAAQVPTVAVIGTQGIHGRFTPFGSEENDGLVAVSEARAEWLAEEIHVPVVHTFLPSSRRIAEIMLQRLRAMRS
jgi:pimeloyl-ACP methyl ester carboxylesterase